MHDTAAAPGCRPSVTAYLEDTTGELLEQLTGWLRLRSVSAEEEHFPDLLRSANWLAGTLRDTGFPVAEVWTTDGAPAVYAEWCAAPGAPTVLVYSHHDVRAAKDADWEQTPPFEPALRDGRLYGRGASDAKGQVLCHVWALRAHLAATGRNAPAVNLKMLVEGEEEANSTHLEALLEDNRERLAADLVVLSDTMLWAADAPAVCTGVRGMLGAQLQVLGPLRDIHAGAVSGPAPNPAVELSRLLAQLHDDDGRVTLPGFYDSVQEPSERERAALAALPFTEQGWVERTHTRSIGGEAGYSVPERLYLRPAVEVMSLIAGDPVGASRAAIPSVATADLSIRTVPGQTVAQAAEQLRRWVAERISDRVDYELTVSEADGQEPYTTPAGLPALAALREAMEEGFGMPVGQMRGAGSAPAELMSRVLDIPVLFFGTGLPEDNWHDSDESVHVATLLNGAASMAHYWPRLAALGTADLSQEGAA
ncbi:M20/M25/M40 family metallo-hydrolase [Motilibacter aurantiacus]|uniref:M20/M25/M40 family metallo-hydrolase n=1 Tax=Motilibacter aurantiacus TaxID=2714955 RepID=UPI001409259E|nr:M20 family dipeptidase [Motilibacter aurantiacus]